MAYTTGAKVLTKLGITTSDFSSDTITNEFIPRADALIEARTGKTWATPSNQTDYFDMTENPYHTNPWTGKGFITGTIPVREGSARWSLSKTPITRIDRIYLLGSSNAFGKVYVYDASETTYTDRTNDSNTIMGVDSPYSIGGAEDDILYIGHNNPFLGVGFNLSTLGTTGVLTWEYWNGTAWTTLTVTSTVTNASNMTATGGVNYYSIPNDWQETTVNSLSYYWLRLRVSTAFDTVPTINNVYFDQDGVLIDEVSLNEVKWDSKSGDLLLLNTLPSEGVRKVRVDYYAGASTVPALVESLSTVLSAKMVMTGIMGGTYNDITGGSVAGKTFQYGEPYTNLRATIVELNKEEELLWKLLGYNVFIAVC